MPNQGFNKKQKQEIAEIVGEQISEVLKPFIKVQNDRWIENDKRWEEADRKFNAILSELQTIHTKLDAFIDKTVQHDEKLQDHELRIKTVESLIVN